MSFQGFNYVEHWNNFRQLLANDPYAGDPMMQAFVASGWMLMSQLGPVQQLQTMRPDCAARLPALVRTPFVLGYIFGAAASALDRGGIDRNDSQATAVIVGVHQLVFDGASFEDCVQLSGLAVGDGDFARGMHSAGIDADALAATNEAPAMLSKWLKAQLDVVAPLEKTS